MCGSVVFVDGGSDVIVPTPGRGRCQRAKRSHTSDGGGVSTAGRRGTPGAPTVGRPGRWRVSRGWCSAPGSPQSGAVGSLWDVRARPSAQPPAGGARRGAGRRVRRACSRPSSPASDWGDALPGWVSCSAVACPSGLRSTPRKRVTANTVRGFKSLRHRHTTSENSQVNCYLCVCWGVP